MDASIDAWNGQAPSCYTNMLECRLFECAPLSMLVLDARSDPASIVCANGRARRWVQPPSAEGSTPSIDAHLPPSVVRGLLQRLSEDASGEPAVVETTFERTVGPALPVRLNAVPFTDLGPGRIILTVQDITHEAERRARLQAVDEDRRRIASELHDDLAQRLAGMRLRVALWHKWLDEDPQRLHAEFEGIRSELGSDIADTRRVIGALKPAALEADGFAASLTRMIERAAARDGRRCSLEISMAAAQVPRALELPILRIVQEALNNAAMHAKAASVEVRLSGGANGEVELVVSDDGVGFDTGALGSSALATRFGLQLMRERVESFGGRLEIQSEPGRGTTLRVALPNVHDRSAGPMAGSARSSRATQS